MEYPNFTGKGPVRCSQTDPDQFVPSLDDPRATQKMKEAKKVCLACPYVAECLDFALRNGESGVWGATTETERRKMLRRSVLTPTRPRPLV